MAQTRPRTETTLSRNLKYLLALKGWSEAELARRAGVGQKTVNTAVHGVYRTKVETVEQLAKPFGLQGWNLIHPGTIKDIESGGTLSQLINAYMGADADGQKLIMQVAERETKYRSR